MVEAAPVSKKESDAAPQEEIGYGVQDKGLSFAIEEHDSDPGCKLSVAAGGDEHDSDPGVKLSVTRSQDAAPQAIGQKGMSFASEEHDSDPGCKLSVAAGGDKKGMSFAIEEHDSDPGVKLSCEKGMSFDKPHSEDGALSGLAKDPGVTEQQVGVVSEDEDSEHNEEFDKMVTAIDQEWEAEKANVTGYQPLFQDGANQSEGVVERVHSQFKDGANQSEGVVERVGRNELDKFQKFEEALDNAANKEAQLHPSSFIFHRSVDQKTEDWISREAPLRKPWKLKR